MKRFFVLLVALLMPVCSFAQDDQINLDISNIANVQVVDSTGVFWVCPYGEGYYKYSDDWCRECGDVVSVSIEPFKVVIEKEYIKYADWNAAYTIAYDWNLPNIVQQKQVSVHRRWKLVYVVKEGKIEFDRVIRAEVTPERIVPQHTEPARIEWPE